MTLVKRKFLRLQSSQLFRERHARHRTDVLKAFIWRIAGLNFQGFANRIRELERMGRRRNHRMTATIFRMRLQFLHVGPHGHRRVRIQQITVGVINLRNDSFRFFVGNKLTAEILLNAL